MGRLWRTRSGWVVAIVLTAALVVPVASGIASETRPSTVPTKLVGKWTRKVTSADAKRARGLTIFVGHVFTLSIARNGNWNASTPNLGNFGYADGKMVSAGPTRIRFVDVGSAGGVYGWRVAGGTLTFTKVRDSVSDRIEVFWGVWKRK